MIFLSYQIDTSYKKSISFYSDSILCYINSSPTIFPIVIAAMFRPPSIIHLLRATKKQSSAFLQPNKQGWIGSKPDLKFDLTQVTFSRTLPNTGIFALKMRKKSNPKPNFVTSRPDLSQISKLKTRHEAGKMDPTYPQLFQED